MEHIYNKNIIEEVYNHICRGHVRHGLNGQVEYVMEECRTVGERERERESGPQTLKLYLIGNHTYDRVGE